MKEQSIAGATESRPVWESLERFARQGVQRLLQQVLEEEVFKRRTEEVGPLLSELYLHGLAHGDFDLALRGLLGEAAPLSAPSIVRLKAGWQGEYETRMRRRLDDLELVYVWADGIYVKAGLEQDEAAMLVLIAALRDGRKVVLESGYRESTESWAALLGELKALGLRAPAAHRRRPPGDRGRRADGLPHGARAAASEPSPRERARHAAEDAPGGGPGVAHEDPLRGDAGGGGSATRRIACGKMTRTKRGDV